MKTLNIHEAKTHLSKLLEQVADGETITIAKAGKPIAKLVPYTSGITERTPGLLKGQIWIGPDAFSRETDLEIEKMMTDAPLHHEEPIEASKIAEAPQEYNKDKK